tara:strand:- start:537 stop:878 length:342 start_codon:yes stop_codon:yes gene_type:complete
MYTSKGEVKSIKEVRQVSDTFKVREFTVTIPDAEYPQVVSFQLSQDKCDVINNFKVGDMIEVFWNLRGREWTNPQGEVKTFNTLDAWKINSQVPEAIKEDTTVKSEDKDNLPF